MYKLNYKMTFSIKKTILIRCGNTNIFSLKIPEKIFRSM